MCTNQRIVSCRAEIQSAPLNSTKLGGGSNLFNDWVNGRIKRLGWITSGWIKRCWPCPFMTNKVYILFHPVIGSFGSHAKKPMQSWIVHCVSSLMLSSSSVDSPPVHRFDHRNFIFCTYAPSICTWISEYNLYFLNGSHFSSFLHVVLLTTWFSWEPSYFTFAQMPNELRSTRTYI